MGLFGAGKRRVCAVVAASTGTGMAQTGARGLARDPYCGIAPGLACQRCGTRGFLPVACGGNRFQESCATKHCSPLAGVCPLAANFAAPIEAELFWLMQAREAGCSWCDVEMETLRALPGKTVRRVCRPFAGAVVGA